MNEVRPQRLMVTPALSHFGEGESDGSTVHPPESDSKSDAKRTRLRGLPGYRGYLSAAEALPELRSVRLLRFIEEQACDQALSQDLTSDYQVVRAGRKMALWEE
jgi:hypothetical protein